MDLDKLIRVYVKIRDEKTKLTKDYQEQIAKLDESLDKISQELLTYCKETNQEGGRTESGTFYRTVRSKFWTSDWEAMHKFIRDTGELGLLEKRIQQTNMRAWLEDNPQKVPPGLNTNSEYAIVVKKPKK